MPARRPRHRPGGAGAAIRYAAVDKDAVIVAAAGNTGTTGSFGGGTACESNPLTDLSRPMIRATGRVSPRCPSPRGGSPTCCRWPRLRLKPSRRNSPWPGRGWESPPR
ncbi:hypothetical protein I553_1069 [Mycobacterium xenopi 4042]|uniref:Subtilase family protein n=1 Tax=Mycobacterium xenopi 4042 TaxID=1299334 RepID=X7Z9N9_MYCXE|nr:hypothetical protein I553_1069 [Mycobacterium xenopi 4042]